MFPKAGVAGVLIFIWKGKGQPRGSTAYVLCVPAVLGQKPVQTDVILWNKLIER